MGFMQADGLIGRKYGAALEAVAFGERTGRPYDLLLMDWSMTGMDGVECAATLGERAALRPTIVMVSADGRA